MTVEDRRRVTHLNGWKALAGSLVAVMTLGLSPVGVTAQDASPMASPVVFGECVAPDLPPGTPTPMDMGSPVVEEVPDIASPVAVEPVEEAEAPVGTTAEGAEAEEIIGAMENIVSCLNSGNYEGTVALMTTNFMMSEFGTGNPHDVVMFLEGFSFQVQSIDNPMTYDDGRVSVDFQYQETPYSVSAERWFFVDEDGTRKLDSVSFITPDIDVESSTIVGVALGENEDGTYFITPNTSTVVQSEAIIFHGRNDGAMPHEIVALRLPEGVDPMGLLDGSVSEEDVEFYGVIFLQPGEEGDLTLLNVEPGTLTLVCFIPGPDGAPHAAHGMISQVEVVESTI